MRVNNPGTFVTQLETYQRQRKHYRHIEKKEVEEEEEGDEEEEERMMGRVEDGRQAYGLIDT